MKNKIFLILFSIFAFAVPKQTQPMSAAKKIAQDSCTLVKNNKYLFYLHCILSMHQSNYDNLFFLRHRFFRYYTKFIISLSIFIAGITSHELLSILPLCYDSYKMYKASLNIEDNIDNMPSEYEMRTYILVTYAGMLRAIANYKPEYIPKVLKYTFALLLYLRSPHIINGLSGLINR